jgi:hypothetical protein
VLVSAEVEHYFVSLAEINSRGSEVRGKGGMAEALLACFFGPKKLFLFKTGKTLCQNMTWLQPKTQKTVHFTVSMPVIPTLLPAITPHHQTPPIPPAKSILKAPSLPCLRQLGGWD